MTLHEIVVLVKAPADGDDEENGVRIPPSDGQETNEDSDDENEGNLNHLTCTELLTECDIVLVNERNRAATEVNADD